MKNARILLVDDEVVFAENMARLLENRGYRAHAVHDGRSALELLAQRDFDVVVLDLRMPGLDGLATLQEIKAAGHITEVLILTGHGAIDSALQAIKLGAYDYLTKPCEIDDLVAKIEGAWEKKDADARAELEERIQKIVESPSAVFDMVRKPERKKPEDA
jgi:DNA-binding NtrC family response regulator